MEWTTLMHAVLRGPKDTLSTNVGLWKWTILYGYTFISLIKSMVYNILVKFELYIFLDPRL